MAVLDGFIEWYRVAHAYMDWLWDDESDAIVVRVIEEFYGVRSPSKAELVRDRR